MTQGCLSQGPDSHGEGQGLCLPCQWEDGSLTLIIASQQTQLPNLIYIDLCFVIFHFCDYLRPYPPPHVPLKIPSHVCINQNNALLVPCCQQLLNIVSTTLPDVQPC